MTLIWNLKIPFFFFFMVIRGSAGRAGGPGEILTKFAPKGTILRTAYCHPEHEPR